MDSARTRIGIAATALAVSMASCALPPPAEDRGLTSEVDEEYRANTELVSRVDDRAGGDPGPPPTTEKDPASRVNAEPDAGSVPDPTGGAVSVGNQGSEAGTDSEPDPPPGAAADSTTGAGASAPTEAVPSENGTEVAIVDSAPTTTLDRVETDATVASPEAIERDPSNQEAPASDAELKAKSFEETVTTDEGAGDATAEAPTFELRTLETADGLAMTYRIGGTGDTALVFVHGWCGNGGQWDRWMLHFAGESRVVAVDLLGHGASKNQNRATWTVPAFGEDVARLLEKEDLRDVILVGHAMGAPVSLEAAVRAPNRVAGIVGVDALHALGGEPDPERMEAAAAGFESEYMPSMRKFVETALPESTRGDVRQAILDDARDTKALAAVALMRHFGSYRPKTIAPRVEVPVVCINSTSVPTDLEGNRTLLTSFRYTPIEDVGHWPHMESPDQFESALLGALQYLAPPPPIDEESRLHGLNPVLPATDPVTLAQFYVDELRFVEIGRSGADLEAPDAISLQRDELKITLQSRASQEREFGKERAPSNAVVFLLVSSFEGERARFSAALRQQVIYTNETSKGARQLAIPDPDGNVIVVQQAKKKRKRAPAEE